MAHSGTTSPEPGADERPAPSARALDLLGVREFRRLYLAVAVSRLGDAFHYVALMWVALVAGGPLGVLAVRMADSLPALVFGLHGGLVADRRSRRRMMVEADLARAALPVPVAVGALTGHLPLWTLVGAAFLLTAAATSSPRMERSCRRSSAAGTSSRPTRSSRRPPTSSRCWAGLPRLPS